MKSHLITISLYLLITFHATADRLAKTLAEYKSADKELNAVYQQAKQTLKEAEFKELQKQQRDWIESRDWLAESQARDKPLDSSPAYWNAMTMYTEERVAFIKAWITVKPKDTWEGVYKDCAGGTVTISKKNDVLTFSIDVVRGPTFHLGEIKGTLITNKDKARFSDKGDPDYHEKGEETWLDFEQLGDGLQIKISGTNTLPYHGVRAFFDGTYRRFE